ncbi:hypothetical protein ARMGADRAFT_1034973 [Armillaria gallica]|uniref:Uncharacterized protein n=1 Tax=Armillaria gallica TaxID=47427 RepID=A0A2H3CVM0_ARMGA|nr:hypothetical protein ARMGADRAFT_1034973 [Armillaria gallica]
MNSEAHHIAPTDSALVEGINSIRESTLPDTTMPGGESGSYAGGGSEVMSSHTQEEESLESQLEEINVPGDHSLSFIGGLYRFWFHEWLEESGYILRHENSLPAESLMVHAGSQCRADIQPDHACGL